MLTRQAIDSGEYLDHFESLPNLWTTDRIERSLAETMKLKPAGTGSVWIFAYGSLMWNPMVHFDRRQIATLHGWHRSFCLRMDIGRASPETSGRMLGSRVWRAHARRGVEAFSVDNGRRAPLGMDPRNGAGLVQAHLGAYHTKRRHRNVCHRVRRRHEPRAIRHRFLCIHRCTTRGERHGKIHLAGGDSGASQIVTAASARSAAAGRLLRSFDKRHIDLTPGAACAG